MLLAPLFISWCTHYKTYITYHNIASSHSIDLFLSQLNHLGVIFCGPKYLTDIQSQSLRAQSMRELHSDGRIVLSRGDTCR